ARDVVQRELQSRALTGTSAREQPAVAQAAIRVRTRAARIIGGLKQGPAIVTEAVIVVGALPRDPQQHPRPVVAQSEIAVGRAGSKAAKRRAGSGLAPLGPTRLEKD